MRRGQWHWTFYGFETPAGNRPVRDWVNGLSEDGLDELVDVLAYMQVRPNTEWSPENFKPLENGLSEIRFETEDHWYRIYGCFGPERQEYTFLHGTTKKVKNDKDGKKLASDRRDQLQPGARVRARVHQFRIEE
jgi:hypothetical protein